MKKQLLLAAFCCAVSAFAAPGNMIGRQTQNEGIVAVPVKGEVRIDASLDDWDLSGRILSFMDTSIRDSFSVRTAAMWDARHLYLSFYWRDPFPLINQYNPEFDPARGWMADAVQLRVVAGKQTSWLTAWCYNGNVPVLDIAYWEFETKAGRITGRLYKGAPGRTELGDGILSAYRKLEDGKGFIHEMRIPWKLLFRQEKKMSAGEKIRMGMEFIWGKPSGKGWPIHRYADNMAPGKTSREFYWTARNAWGEILLSSAPVKTPRKYTEGSAKPQGAVCVRATVPADSVTFTIVIEDGNGKRVRNLAGGFRTEDYTVAKSGGSAAVEVQWDALDDQGRLVPPGTYRVRGLTSKEISGQYEMCFYNPGTPAWSTADGKGGWLADHYAPEFLARSGDRMILCSSFAEGGAGTIAVGADGKKIWSEIKGTSVLTANGTHIFTVPNDWHASGVQLLRLDSRNGRFAPFIRDGKALPMPLPFTALFGFKERKDEKGKLILPRATAMAASGNSLLMVMDNGKAYLLDAGTAAVRKEFPFAFEAVAGTDSDGKKTLGAGEVKVPKHPFAFDGRNMFYFRNGRLFRHDIDSGKAVGIPLKTDGLFSFLSSSEPGKAVEKPSAIALDREGNIYIADLGKDMQIKKFSPDGKMLARFGRKGGRARMGVFDPSAMREMSSVAVDASGRVWTTEFSKSPRRVSVWNPDGSLFRDYIGNSGYAGSGTTLHDNDPSKAYAEGNELSVDLRKHTWRMNNVMWNPDPAGGLFVTPGGSAGGVGHIFYSSASGAKQEYHVALGDFRSTPFCVMMKKGDRWRPVSAITRVANLQGLLGGQYRAQIVKAPYGEFADCDPADILIWNDADGDGCVLRSECEIVPASVKTRLPDKNGRGGRNGIIGIPADKFGWGQRVDPADFSFYASRLKKSGGPEPGIYRFRPDFFKPDGAPVFSSKSWTRLSGETFDLMEAVPVPGKDTVLAFIDQGGRRSVAGISRKNGSLLWAYPSPYHQVHGSHKATMPKPGLLIGCLKITGTVPGCGEAGDVFMIRGNLGQDYYMTADGLYIGSMFQDGRLPNLPLPATEEELRGMPLGIYSGGGEHFCGWIGRHDDGVVRMSCGLAREAGMIVRIDGLDSIRRFTAPSVVIDSRLLVQADRDNAERALAAAKPRKPYTIVPVKIPVDWKRIKGIPIRREGQSSSAEFKAAYDKENLHVAFHVADPSPWRNGGKDFRLLFKSGDCVDIQLSPSGNRSQKPRQGDLRLVMAPFGGKNAVLLMRPVMKNAPESEKYLYSSPVSTFVFDQVKLLPEIQPLVKIRGNGYTVTAKIPWKELGITASPGMKLSGDAGFILSDSAGTVNTARVYWSNRNTNLVNDIPHEAMLSPSAWGEFILGK